MRRHGAFLGLAALLAAAPAPAQQPGDRFTPAPPPTASLPKLTPVAPAGEPRPAPGAVLLPPPVPAVPLAPVVVPGEPPKPAVPSPLAPAPAPVVAPVAAPTPAPIPGPVVAAAPLPGRKPARVEAPQPPAPASAPSPAKAPAPAPSGRRTLWALESVYVRAEPDPKSRIIDGLTAGDTLDLLPGGGDGWLRVGRGGTPLGYVRSRYVSDKPPAAEAEDVGCALPRDLPAGGARTIPAGSAARALADANIRIAPACNARVLDVLDEGDTVTVLSEQNGWYRVARNGQPLGYVGAALLGRR